MWARAAARTQSVNGSIRPVDSAASMKSAGISSVPSGRAQRTSASTERDIPSPSVSLGW